MLLPYLMAVHCCVSGPGHVLDSTEYLQILQIIATTPATSRPACIHWTQETLCSLLLALPNTLSPPTEMPSSYALSHTLTF